MSFKSVTLLVLIGLFIIVCIQNVETIPLHFLLWSVNISKLLLLLITLIIGILVGVIIPGIWRKSKEEEKIEVK
jgi:lipopolysaccharide assembly protein A